MEIDFTKYFSSATTQSGNYEIYCRDLTEKIPWIWLFTKNLYSKLVNFLLFHDVDECRISSLFSRYLTILMKRNVSGELYFVKKKTLLLPSRQSPLHLNLFFNFALNSRISSILLVCTYVALSTIHASLFLFYFKFLNTFYPSQKNSLHLSPNVPLKKPSSFSKRDV